MKTIFQSMLALGVICSFMTMDAGWVQASKEIGGNLIPESKAEKIVAERVGSDILRVDFLNSSSAHPYYRVIIDRTTGEFDGPVVTDVFVDARTGKIFKIMEDPTEMPESTYGSPS